MCDDAVITEQHWPGLETTKVNVEDFSSLDFVELRYGLQNGAIFVYYKFCLLQSYSRIDTHADFLYKLTHKCKIHFSSFKFLNRLLFKEIINRERWVNVTNFQR